MSTHPLLPLQMYGEAFEMEFLLETEAIYRSEALRLMRDQEFTVSQPLVIIPFVISLGSVLSVSGWVGVSGGV